MITLQHAVPESLEKLAREVARGTLLSWLGDVVGFSDIAHAIARSRRVPRAAKAVADPTR